MAKVSLRIYNREIESLIDQGHTDEAIAHCHHILKTFSKHLETYRLLGKAYLEAKHSNEAVDVFNRVLMAVPDDFVAHVGMSIISDDANKLDDAIWHMERAYEAQPSNTAIQGELQRLYGRRDGMEPPKIRMTRGALAHMYMQGDLYPQAISEIRAVLSQDPQRADMQVLLANAYFRGGQKADASDMCAQLLKRYPYCFDANRILVELLPGSERAESTQVYRHRIYELDPYATFAKESVFRSNEVPDASINLERLEYSGQEVAAKQDWGASLGIELASAPSTSDEQPDWLKSGFGESQPAPATISQPEQNIESAPAAPAEDDIPDFLRQAGWGESSGAAEEPVSFDSTSENELTPAAIPDWLKGQMPSEPEPVQPASSKADGPDWLNDLSGAQFKEPAASSSDQLPDWLSGLDSSQPVEATPASSEQLPDWKNGLDSSQPVEETPAPSEQLPDWLSGLDSGQPVESASASSLPQDIPDWLTGLDADQAEEPVAKITPVPQEEPMPNRLFSNPVNITPEPIQPVPPQPESPKPAAEPASLETLGTSAKEQDDAVAWLEMLASKHGARQEEMVTDPAARFEKPPEWVDQARALGESQAPALPVEQAAEPQTPVTDETGMWLRDLEEKDTASEIQAVEEPLVPAQEVAQPADLPDWLSGLQNESAGQDSADHQPVAEEPLPQQDVSDWLSSLDKESELADQIASESKEEPATPQSADMPDWLNALKVEPVSGVEDQEEVYYERNTKMLVTDPSETVQSDSAKPESADLPEWLRGLDETQPAPADAVKEDLPSWLKTEAEIGEEQPQAEPTEPSDWHPAEPKFQAPAPEPEPEVESRQPAPRTVAPLPVTPPPPDVRKPAARPAAAQKPAPRARPAAESPQVSVSVLNQAQGELNRGDIPTALNHYNKLIKKGKYLEETIRNLSESLYRYPVEVSIWQALGDAYMRANRLQEALDAYNKAEELIR